MALTLYLLRHAKAIIADGSVPDFTRPLAARGQREAAALAALSAERAYAPAHVLCSGAQRTRETLAPLLAAWPSDVRIEIVRDLYNAGAEKLLAAVRREDDGVRSLMLVGHNPGIEQLARSLAASGADDAVRRLRDHYPPAGLAVIVFEVSAWSDVRPGGGRLDAFETPSG